MSWLITKPQCTGVVYYTGMTPDLWTHRMDHALRFERKIDAELLASSLALTGATATDYRCDCGHETYQILYARTSDELVDDVRAAQRAGWTPLGGPYFANCYHRQAMVRESRPWLLPHQSPPVCHQR